MINHLQKPVVVISANTSWYVINFRENIIRELIRVGYRVEVLAPRDSHTERITAIGAGFVDIPLDQGGKNPFKDLLTIFAFYRAYKTVQANVIFNFTPKNNIYGSIAARVLGIPVVNNIAGMGSVFIDNSFIAVIVKSLYRLSQKKVKKVYFQNFEDMQIFLDSGIVRVEQAYRLPGSGVDLQRFSPVPFENNVGIRFIFVGRMLYEKGVLEYVESARKLRKEFPNAEFRMLGFVDVNNSSAVGQKLVDEWHAEGCIKFLGQTNTIEKELAEVDCVVLPSYYREGVPRSLLEAAAMGKVIVTTDNVGCRETVIDGVSGFLCKPKSVEDLTEKLRKIVLMDRENIQEMGRQGRLKVEREFDEKIVIKSYLDQVEDILNLSHLEVN